MSCHCRIQIYFFDWRPLSVPSQVTKHCIINGNDASLFSRSPSSKTSFFGSLRRNTGVTTSTPKGTPAATRINDVAKTTESPQLRNRPPDKEKRPWFRTTSSNLIRKDPVSAKQSVLLLFLLFYFQIKSSITSLNSNAQNSPNVTKRRRPLTLQLVSNVTVRR